MNEKFPMTRDGFDKLKSELDELKQKQRPQVIKAISEAREHGDLSENAEYHAAREKQSFIEGKISELENKISRAEIIDPKTINSSSVTFGATVQIIDLENGNQQEYKIVGVDESDIEKKLISINAPICKAMLNKNIDDVFQVETPNGSKEYQIKKIDFK
ncbi:MAG: transcription elongation factor GreA [Rickettsiales bacterium]|nr:transcription elongation factor GreA [Rickettsiales bacterium]